jgi:hypothetical protein
VNLFFFKYLLESFKSSHWEGLDLTATFEAELQCSSRCIPGSYTVHDGFRIVLCQRESFNLRQTKLVQRQLSNFGGRSKLDLAYIQVLSMRRLNNPKQHLDTVGFEVGHVRLGPVPGCLLKVSLECFSNLKMLEPRPLIFWMKI